MEKKYVKVVLLCVAVCIAMSSLLLLSENKEEGKSKIINPSQKFQREMIKRDLEAQKKVEDIIKSAKDNGKIDNADSLLIKKSVNLICDNFSNMCNLSEKKQLELCYSASLIFAIDEKVCNQVLDDTLKLKETKVYMLGRKAHNFMGNYTNDYKAQSKNKEDYTTSKAEIEKLCDEINDNADSEVEKYIELIEKIV